MRFLLAFSPVFCGLLAGFLYLMDIRSLEALAAAGEELRGAAIFAGILTLAVGAVVSPRALGSILTSSREDKSAGYKHPEIFSARVTEATLRPHEGPIRIGEFEISSSHPKHVSAGLNFIPAGSIIQTLKRGSTYRLRFPIQPLTIGANTDRSDRLFVEEVARANGYRGRIQ